jgi:hypothetical protein
MVYEEPGAEKGIFRRVVDKINPFSSSDAAREAPEKKSSETGIEMLAKKKPAEKQESPGMLASFWGSINPFGGDASSDNKNTAGASNRALVDQVDGSLKTRGIDSATRTAALKPPAADLPKVEEPAPVQNTDTSKLLGSIDTTLSKSGRNPDQLPPPPAAAEAFNDTGAVQALASRGGTKTEAQPLAATGLLSEIDQKLKSQGFDPSSVPLPEAAPQAPAAAAAAKPATVELEPRITSERGSLFLGSSEVQPQQNVDRVEKPEEVAADPQPGNREFPQAIVQRPAQPAASPGTPKGTNQKAPQGFGNEEEPGMFDQVLKDADNLGKLLNPFRW